MKILAIGAHHDDIEIGCGGTLLKRVAQGDEIVILTVTDSAYFRSDNGFARTAESAEKESKEASEIIDARLISLRKPCLDLLNSEKLVHDILYIVEKEKPDMVFAHWGGDFHSDHMAVSQASIRACRLIPTILLYRSNWYSTENNFNANYFVDISNYFDRKIEAIKCYKSVLEAVNYSWVDFVTQQNKYQGAKIGVKAAECFSCLKLIEY